MRIPLDYYRILGLPLAASDEQLRQAYSDRIVQMPRREYSLAAISSRKQLIEEAYVVLSDPKERSSYDQLYLAHAYDPDGTASRTGVADNPLQQEGSFDTQSLSIEITQDELVGALLILQDLGEYEIVLKLGRPYLVNKSGTSSKTGKTSVTEEFSDSADRPDVVLTIALACLELGREQWQQGHYENAANSLETGQEILLREGLFVSVQDEIQADLYKLRPYRILELLSLPEAKTAERRQGLELLQSILEDRGGIDGNGNDESGLNIDDFLRFIQQLRNHLTVAEQHKLFEAESKRPSAVATYLAVYALIARGFAQRQPALIYQAKQMLIRLGKRQDVHLEQSLCALLLGQTEEATRVLELSQEYEALAFIREKSQDSPDLLPGLCLYGEQWLQHEVFPHFRDLAQQKASLKDYFAEPKVQAYLEALPTDATTTNEWSVINRQPISPPTNIDRRRTAGGSTRQFYPNRTPDPELPQTPSRGQSEPKISSPPSWNLSTPTSAGNDTPEASIAERTNRGANHNLNGSARVSASNHAQKRRRRKPVSPSSRYPAPEHSHPPNQLRQFLGGTLEGKTRLVWVVLGLLAAILVLWLVISTTLGWVKGMLTPRPTLQANQLTVEINQPPMPIPDANSTPQPPAGTLSNEIAEQVIRNWLSTKAAALGLNHDIESLREILTGSALSQWQIVAQQEKADNRYRTYEHSVQVKSVDNIASDPDHAVAEAIVKEATQFYQNGQLKKSSEEKLQVRYDLKRREGVWRIQSMSVVNKISMDF